MRPAPGSPGGCIMLPATAAGPVVADGLPGAQRRSGRCGRSPELPPGYAAIFGSTKAGTYRGGLWRTPEMRQRFGILLAMAGVKT